MIEQTKAKRKILPERSLTRVTRRWIGSLLDLLGVHVDLKMLEVETLVVIVFHRMSSCKPWK